MNADNINSLLPSPPSLITPTIQNIMKLGDGLFLNTCRDIAEEYKSSGIAFNDMIVDNW